MHQYVQQKYLEKKSHHKQSQIQKTLGLFIDDSNEEFPKLYHNPIQYVTLKGILWICGN